ncbi:MAG: winged helix-turn-helix transcriptional regulator [Anaerolineales bacterium]|nr:winged helix-turn-helix transcriptional regulator [Anaerolineales bacterium]MCK5633754.1 winged helix-turn-helix transcriptional regulator [Anaerolineales bacterium]
MANNLEQSAGKFLLLMDRLRQLGPQTAPPKGANISLSQLAFLTFSGSNPGCGIQAISSGLKLSKPTVSIGVSQLEDAGFLTRQPDPEDGRAVQLFLTPKGQELLERTNEFRCRKFKRLLTGLTPKERTTLLALLDRAIQTVENEEQGDMK